MNKNRSRTGSWPRRRHRGAGLAGVAAMAHCAAAPVLAQLCGWESLAGGGFAGVSPKVRVLAAFDHGGGPRLYAGGVFSESLGSPGNRIARWDGSSWSPLGRGTSSTVWALTVFDGGARPELYVGGTFVRAGEVGGANGIARWDGAQWSALGTGLYNEDPGHTHNGSAIVVYDDGAGPALYVGGHFTHAGGLPAGSIARWDGSEWSAVGEGFDGWVRAMADFDDGAGRALYAGGYFFGGVARWKDGVWEVGTGSMAIHAFAVFDDGSGPALYAGGQNGGGLARWDGERWSVVGGGTDFSVNALHVFDDGSGPALYVGGAFFTAGGKESWGIAKWDGKEWHDLDGGIYDPSFFSVDAMTTFDDGSGPALYVAGKFTVAGGPSGIPVENIARWRCGGVGGLLRRLRPRRLAHLLRLPLLPEPLRRDGPRRRLRWRQRLHLLRLPLLSERIRTWLSLRRRMAVRKTGTR
jgi:trimeric autotransporter adhesin